MSWRFVEALNESFATLDPELLQTIVEYKTPLDAVRASGIEIDAIERKFLRDIPGSVWGAMQGSIAEAAGSGKRLTLDLSRGFGYSLSVSTLSAASKHVALVLQAPEVRREEYRTASTKTPKTRSVKARVSAKKRPAARKTSRKRAR